MNGERGSNVYERRLNPRGIRDRICEIICDLAAAMGHAEGFCIFVPPKKFGTRFEPCGHKDPA